MSELLPRVLQKYKIAALPATYNGVRFDSTTEAKWAVFMDTLGLPYIPEPEGYDLDGVWYRPDFWLPTLNLWIEIKGPDPDDSDCTKAHRLAMQSGSPVYVFFGGIIVPNSVIDAPHAYAFLPDGTADERYFWCECPQCGSVGIHYEGRADRLRCKETSADWMQRVKLKTPWVPSGCHRQGNNGDRGTNRSSLRLTRAYHAAWAWRP